MPVLRKLTKSLKDLRTVVAMLPALLAVFNNAVFAIVPLTPVLRARASFLIVFTALASIVITHRYALSTRNRKTKSRELIRLAVLSGAGGILLLGVYGIFLTYIQVHPANDPIVDTILDWLQILLFTAPFVCWTICLAALGHEASDWLEPKPHASRKVHHRRAALHPRGH